MGNLRGSATRDRMRRLRRSGTGSRSSATTIAGVLLLVTFAAGLLSVVPVLEEADYLGSLPGREVEVVVGALFQVLMAAAYAAFALVLHPTLRRAGATMSLGFVTFRLIAVGFHLLAVAMLPLFLDLAAAYDQGASTSAPSAHEAVAEALRRGRDLVNHFVIIVAMGFGDLLFFALLRRRRLVPAWLSVWGLAAVALAILGSLLLLARVVDVVSVAYLALTGPLAVQGLVLAVWLIVRGFDTRLLPVLDPGRAQPPAA
ncbi:DUF4386 domain-containing protein [Agromyces sp. ZXT2-6]|uniref:DUF4386 domain-containing protein n=1 Tax=Agromyces sp. ZXT2-6 TaxID=3461153 RepID=UPI0040552E57